MRCHQVKCAVVVIILSVAIASARPAPSGDFFFPTDDHTEHSLPVFEQSAASNTGSQTIVGKDGSQQHQNFGSSQSANIASDLSKGDLSAAHTQQQLFQSGDKTQLQNTGQSQSASFDKDRQALSNANTNTNLVRDGATVRESTSGGAGSSLKTAEGSQASQAQTNSESFKEPGKEGSRTTGSAQSQHIGMDGTGSTSNANTGSEKIVLADGTVITKSFGSSSSFQTTGNKKASSMAQTISQSFGG